MSTERRVEYGPPGKHRFPRALTIAYRAEAGQYEIALAVDDGERAHSLTFRPVPEGRRASQPLRSVAFPQGGAGRATTVLLGARYTSVHLEFLDGDGRRIDDISCTLDLQDGTASPPPFSGDGYRLERPLRFGPPGSSSQEHAITLFDAEGEGPHILCKLLVDDGGDADQLLATSPVSDQTRLLPILRATSSSPACVEVRVPAEDRTVYFDFIERSGAVLRDLSFRFDFESGTIAGPSPSSASPAYRNYIDHGKALALTTICRVCREEKALATCLTIARLPLAEQVLIEDEGYSLWDFPHVCSECHERKTVVPAEQSKLSRLGAYGAAASGTLGLFSKAYLGALSPYLPHGPILRDLLLALAPALEARNDLLTMLLFVIWSFLFTLIPAGAIGRSLFRVLYGVAWNSAPLMLGSLAVQGSLVYAIYIYATRWSPPPFVPQEAQLPFLWPKLYLYAVTACLLNVVFSEFLAQSFRSLVDRLIRRGPGVASRVNRIFRRFHRLLGAREDEEVREVLTKILEEDLGCKMFQLLHFDPARKIFVPTFAHGRPFDEVSQVKVSPGDPNIIGHAAMFGEIYGTHRLKDPDLRRTLSRPPIPSVACVPVKVGGEVQALINVEAFSDERNECDADDLAHLSTLSSLLAVALSNLEVHKKRDEELARSRVEVEEYAQRFEQTLGALRMYVPPVLADKISKDPRKYLSRDAERASMTFLFSDLKGFSTLSEEIGDPAKLAGILNEYLAAMTEVLFMHWGTLDKYIGDAVMAFFGKPYEYPDHPIKGVLAALDMQARIRELNRKPGLEGLAARIGVHTGEAVVGNMGSPVRVNYTVMGDSVNVAARLEPTNKVYGTSILISGETYDAAGDAIHARPIDQVRVVGRDTPVILYEPVARKEDTIAPEMARMIEQYTAGLECYLERRFSEAVTRFQGALEAVPDDGPSRVLKARCEEFAATPPPGDWDGIFELKTK